MDVVAGVEISKEIGVGVIVPEEDAKSGEGNKEKRKVAGDL